MEITKEDFRKMQLLELDMLVEFDRVCRKHSIRYTIFGGTLLGAVRHRGFIPWDDDADIAMLREDYERFRAVATELDQDICYFQDHINDPEYRWGYGKLRRTGTKYVRMGQEHLKCRTGVFVDVFPMDNVPKSVPGQMLQDFFCMCMRKVLWSEVGRLDRSVPAPKRMLFGMLSRIRPDAVFKAVGRMERSGGNSSGNRVRVLLFPATGTLYRKNPLRTRYSMPKEWFTELAEYRFEGAMLRGTRDYDGILSYIYGDYMTPPPVSERHQHSPVSHYEL